MQAAPVLGVRVLKLNRGQGGLPMQILVLCSKLPSPSDAIENRNQLWAPSSSVARREEDQWREDPPLNNYVLLPLTSCWSHEAHVSCVIWGWG